MKCTIPKPANRSGKALNVTGAPPAIAYEACPDCDLLLNPVQAASGAKAFCPRCGCLLHRPRTYAVERTLALSVTGLILILPANFLPLVGIRLFGNVKDGNLWSGAAALMDEGMTLVAVLVWLSSVILPVVNLALAFVISLHLHLNKSNRWLARWLRWFQHLNEWAMLEVYALSIIVACVKLSSMADLRFGAGLYSFAALLIVNALLVTEMEYRQFWQKIAALKGTSTI
jgi:paraquat-inducible protein A